MPWMLRMLLNVELLALLGYGYVGLKVDQALSQLTRWPAAQRRWFIVVVIILLNLYPVTALMAYLTGSDWWRLALRGGHRLLDIGLVYPFWVGLVVVAQLIPLLLLIELGRLVLSVMKKNPVLSSPWQANVTLWLMGVVCVYTMARVYCDTWHIRIRERTVQSAKLSPHVSELRIVHISDVQVDPRTEPPQVRAFVQKVNDLNPDLVFFSGDLVTSGTQYIDQAAALMGQIRARYGVFACLGDHDYWADPQWIRRSLSQRGIQVMEDASRTISLGSGQMRVTAVTNTYQRRPLRHQLAQLAPDHDRASFSVFLTHQPSGELIEWAAKQGYDLFLAGHTHGGQVVLNYLGLRLTPVLMETRFVSGFYEVGPMLVSVSNGWGLTFAPLRFQSPAEITLLRLKPAASSANIPEQE